MVNWITQKVSWNLFNILSFYQYSTALYNFHNLKQYIFFLLYFIKQYRINYNVIQCLYISDGVYDWLIILDGSR